MERLYAWGAVAISASILLSTAAFAADLNFLWGNNQQAKTGLITILSKNDHAGAYPSNYHHRSTRQYQYFPSVCVYHDATRGLYFFPRGPEWRIAVSLPSELRTQLEDYVTVELDSDKPYMFNAQHKKRYPPGK